MSRMLFTSALCFGLLLSVSMCEAQLRPRENGPSASTAQQNYQSNNSQRRNAQEQTLPRELLTVLNEWYLQTSGIKTLEGKHRRWVYNQVFEVESRAEGEFWYVSPDKGRIDLKSSVIKPNEVSLRKNKQGQPYTVKPDDPERWICTGTKLMKVNDAQKEFDVYEIPPHGQGRNIMEGPLPFLFGMPPELAKKRYWMELLPKTNQQQVWLKVIPRWQQDAVQYKEARVILDRRRYLPIAVQLFDPSGNRETVFTFTELKVNPAKRSWNLFARDTDPLKPNLAGYKPVIHRQVEQKVADLPKGPAVPKVINYGWKDAKAVLEKAGYKVDILPGRASNDPRLHYVVYAQRPLPLTSLKPGETVTLTVYDDPNRQRN